MHHSKGVIDPSYGGMHHFIYKMIDPSLEGCIMAKPSPLVTIDCCYITMHHPFSSPKVTIDPFLEGCIILFIK